MKTGDNNNGKKKSRRRKCAKVEYCKKSLCITIRTAPTTYIYTSAITLLSRHF